MFHCDIYLFLFVVLTVVYFSLHNQRKSIILVRNNCVYRNKDQNVIKQIQVLRPPLQSLLYHIYMGKKYRL